MRDRILVESLPGPPVSEHQMELVERKGVGHPDSICDAIMEQICVELCRVYLERTGTILHHNIDKALLVAGEAEVRLGGGEVREPMRLIFGDRATFRIQDVEIPVHEIATATAKRWIRENLRFVDPDRHVRYESLIRPGSPELVDIFHREEIGANDTSAAVGYAPLTITEQTVLEVERYMNGPEFKRIFPEAGEDIKVMGVRTGSTLHLTVAVAFVDRFVDSEATYFRRKAHMQETVLEFVRSRCPLEVELTINNADQPGRGLGGMYLTVTGTSAEGGDSGQVGRGNKVNGVIALNRPMGTEAAAGKNPVSHVGKIYTVLAHQMAQRVHEEVRGVRECYVWLASQIGEPIHRPRVAAAQVVFARGVQKERAFRQIREIMERELLRLPQLVQDLVAGKYAML
ncbi:MAG: methionine adenosyltransferase [Armatimonadetes bacterium]|nr:methionine adenosyltransferase [Armatimonadota bacterium]MDW8152939.1 methionine adenosyltransferase [Armatimonadota bacterium]